MRFGKISAAIIATVALVSTPVMAQSLSPSASVAAKSSVKRVGAATKEESKQSSSIILYVIAAAVVIGGIILLTDDDEPESP